MTNMALLLRIWASRTVYSEETHWITGKNVLSATVNKLYHAMFNDMKEPITITFLKQVSAHSVEEVDYTDCVSAEE